MDATGRRRRARAGAAVCARAAGLTLLAAALATTAAAQSRTLDPHDAVWALRGQAAVGTRLGTSALTFGLQGAAWAPSVRLQDGTIAFDVLTSDVRSFVGVRFRAESEQRFEEIYLRPHKSGQPDALQYAPAFEGGRTGWQLYHGPGNTAFADFPYGRWLHVELVIRGSRAALFLGGSTTPQLVVDHLALPERPGFIGLWAFAPGLDEAATPPTAIANIVVREGAGTDLPAPKPIDTEPDAVREWALSSGFVAPEGAVLIVPDEVRRGPWRVVAADPSGLLPIDREVAWPDKAGRASVLARLRLHAATARVVRLDLGFSDDASVFLDGRLLMSGVNGYSYNFPRRDGVITPDQVSVYLPLNAGDHELIVAVSDVFGGWGLMGRVRDRTGLTIAAR